MELYSVIFVINLIILSLIIAYDCYKKRKKTAVFNSVIFTLFLLLRLAEVHYVAIRAGLLDLLGEERFLALKSVLSKILFFSTSIMVGLELVIEIIGIVLFIVVVANAAAMVILIRKSSRKIFNSTVLPKDEQIEQNGILINPSLYLILGKLIC